MTFPKPIKQEGVFKTYGFEYRNITEECISAIPASLFGYSWRQDLTLDGDMRYGNDRDEGRTGDCRERSDGLGLTHASHFLWRKQSFQIEWSINFTIPTTDFIAMTIPTTIATTTVTIQIINTIHKHSKIMDHSLRNIFKADWLSRFRITCTIFWFRYFIFRCLDTTLDNIFIKIYCLSQTEKKKRGKEWLASRTPRRTPGFET